MPPRALLLLIPLLIAFGSVPTVPRRVLAVPLPETMAAIGDSITRATNACCRRGDRPANSWSTGEAGGDGVRSHYERVLTAQPRVSGSNLNLAVPGATMADAADQAAEAVARGADYVTIALGANDVCTSSRSTMTSVSRFESQFRRAMEALRSGLPEARMFVSSIPNLYRLWTILHEDRLARLVWIAAGTCRSMLSPRNTEEDRLAVLDRQVRFNDVLARVCAEYPTCRFDGHAVFRHRFTRAEVSRLDFFHPSLAGQATLARITWPRSWWPAIR